MLRNVSSFFWARRLGVGTSGCNKITTRRVSSFPKENKAVVVISHVNEIHFNLAVEDYLMNVVKPTYPLFFWWRNASNVVIGRHQNPWTECRWDVMQKDGVDLARRFSGGGAVYQDLGNSCYTFLLPESCYDEKRNNKILLEVLKEKFNIEGEPSGRNDLMTCGRKFSGSAFKELRSPESETLFLHHGTLLIHTDLQAIEKYLTPHVKKLASKGVSSVASRVINLQELNKDVCHEALEKCLTERFCKEYSPGGDGEIVYIDKESPLTQEPEFRSVYKTLTDWDWLFGKTPEFSHKIEDRLSSSTVELYLDVQSGTIQHVKLFTDSLVPQIVPRVEQALLGTKYCWKDISAKLERERESETCPKVKSELDDICEMMKKHMTE